MYCDNIRSVSGNLLCDSSNSISGDVWCNTLNIAATKELDAKNTALEA